MCGYSGFRSAPPSPASYERVPLLEDITLTHTYFGFETNSLNGGCVLCKIEKSSFFNHSECSSCRFAQNKFTGLSNIFCKYFCIKQQVLTTAKTFYKLITDMSLITYVKVIEIGEITNMQFY